MRSNIKTPICSCSQFAEILPADAKFPKRPHLCPATAKKACLRWFRNFAPGSPLGYGVQMRPPYQRPLEEFSWPLPREGSSAGIYMVFQQWVEMELPERNAKLMHESPVWQEALDHIQYRTMVHGTEPCWLSDSLVPLAQTVLRAKGLPWTKNNAIYALNELGWQVAGGTGELNQGVVLTSYCFVTDYRQFRASQFYAGLTVLRSRPLPEAFSDHQTTIDGQSIYNLEDVGKAANDRIPSHRKLWKAVAPYPLLAYDGRAFNAPPPKRDHVTPHIDEYLRGEQTMEAREKVYRQVWQDRVERTNVPTNYLSEKPAIKKMVDARIRSRLRKKPAN